MTAENRVPTASIVADTAALYGLSVDAILAHKPRPHYASEARSVAMAALECSGYCPAEIGRVLDRDDRGVARALARVHADADMAEFAASIAPSPRDQEPLIIAMALTMLTVPERRAVARYLTGLLLAARPTRGMGWDTGIGLLARHPDALAQLAWALVNVEDGVDRDRWRDTAAGIIQRITYHIRAAGYTRALRNA